MKTTNTPTTTTARATAPQRSYLRTLFDLIKYDLKNILRVVLVFGAVLIAFTILFNLTGSETITEVTDSGISYTHTKPVIIIVLHTLLWNACFACIFAILFNCIGRIWHRYAKNFFGDEAYLTHTLPIKRSTLWFSKFLSIILSLVATLGMVAIACGVLSLSPDGRNLIESFGLFGGDSVSYACAFAFTVLTQLSFFAMCGVIGITLGNRFTHHRRAHSLIWGFIIYFAAVALLSGAILAWSLVYPNLHDALFGDLSNFDLSFVTNLLLFTSSTYTVFVAGLYFVNLHLLQKGINLD